MQCFGEASGARRGRRVQTISALLSGTALVVATASISFAALTLIAPPAWAQATGGAGGFGVFEPGGNGGNPNQAGADTAGNPPGGGSPGGPAGTPPSGNGGDGGTLPTFGGGGGGGGADGTIASPIGGNGGKGGDALCGGVCTDSIGGGGGGAGGTGINLTGSFVNSGNVIGGTGGNGGAGDIGFTNNNAANGGGGGGGGFGIIATIGGLTIINNAGASILGGNGGAGGAGSTGTPAQTGVAGAAGAGGVGLLGFGLTIINNGTIMGGLSGDGVTRADAIVFTGGTNVLTGTGTTGSFTMIGGGTFAPGSGAPGTSMTIAGNLAFQSGAIYLVQVNPATASFANVTGTVTLAGTVQAVFAPGSYIARSHTILSAAGGFGGTTFGALTTASLPTNFNASLSYTPTDVLLT